MRPSILNKLFTKIFVAILLASTTVLLAMVIYINWSFRTGFSDYVNDSELERIEQLAVLAGSAYAAQGNWAFTDNQRGSWNLLLMQIGERPAGGQRGRFRASARPGPGVEKPVAFQAPLAGRVELLDLNQKPLIKARKEYINRHTMQREMVPIAVDGTQVGWLRVYQSRNIAGGLAQVFFQQQQRNFYVIALFATLLSFVLAVWLVRHFLKPVRALSQGTQALRQGEYQTQIQVYSHDELGRLAVDFNALAKTLEQQESLRQQWIADISHELRTPIAVLRCEIEAMLDGIREPTQEHIEELHSSLATLTTLVDDLHQLSMSDAGMVEKPESPIDLVAVLSDVTLGSQTRLQSKQLSLTSQLPELPLTVRGEHKLLYRLFTNLLENCFRYTDEGGQVQVIAEQVKDKVHVVIQDSAPGVPSAALPKLFDRLYRVDKSRSRAFGGSGLGLSICKNLVAAHGGQITAAHSPLGGLRIVIEFPVFGSDEK